MVKSRLLRWQSGTGVLNFCPVRICPYDFMPPYFMPRENMPPWFYASMDFMPPFIFASNHLCLHEYMPRVHNNVFYASIVILCIVIAKKSLNEKNEWNVKTSIKAIVIYQTSFEWQQIISNKFKEKLRCLVRKYTSLSLKEYLNILGSKMNDSWMMNSL